MTYIMCNEFLFGALLPQYYMPKKRRTKQRRYTEVTPINSTTNQKILKTYWRWFNFNQTLKKPNYLLNLKLPGYFTHEFDLHYQYRKPEKKKM